MHKTFKTIDEQIDILEKRGLNIDEKDELRCYLTELNYYRLSGYSLTLRKNDNFYPGTNFNSILQMYQFDKELKIKLMAFLEDIEISLRSYIGYELGKQEIQQDSPVAYLNPDNYISGPAFNEMVREIKDSIGDNKNEAFIKHHNTKYHGTLPSWVLVETLSFGKLSKLLQSLNIDIQKEISNEHFYGKKFKVISNWMESLVILRNLCAHHARLINRGIPHKPDFSVEEDAYFINNGYNENQIGARLFFRLILIDRLSKRPGIHEELKSTIKCLAAKYPFVDLKHYGFTGNWEKILDKMNTK